MKKASISKNNSFTFESFKNLQTLLKPLKLPSFKKAPDSEQNLTICEILFKEIEKVNTPCFLLPAVIEFINEVNKIITPSEFKFSHFEFWLNQFSNITDETNYLIRSKIVGKHIPRDEYQILFPIGSGKRYSGSHYVTAHGSPDLDTTIASFWGWVDAFGARVSDGLHIWNMPPGGVLASLDAAPLTDFFGKDLFAYLSQNRSSLSPLGIDFTNQNTLIKKNLSDSSVGPEDHERHKNAIMIVDSKGFFVGDIRSEDHEGISQILRLVSNNLKWFESSLQTSLTQLFSQKTVTLNKVSQIINNHFDKDVIYSADKRQLTEKLKEQINLYLKNVLGIKHGNKASFRELAETLKEYGIGKLSSLEKKLISAFKNSHIFSNKGDLLNQREEIFKVFYEISTGIDGALDEMQKFMESMEMALEIKREVFNFPIRYATPSAALEEIIEKISIFNYLTVVYPNKDGSLFPLGIIKADAIRSKSLGTVTVRDFCNRSEVHIDSNLEIISVIDHHKTELKTKTPPATLTSDVQSCNVLVAELAFLINDAYSKSTRTHQELENELKTLSKNPLSNSIIRLKNRILKKALAHSKAPSYFIDPSREAFEYLCFLHAIIDDTDLLSKATKRDVYCIASLLNRLQSIEENKEVEIINFDDIDEGDSFVKNAAQAIVKNKKMYSIYSEIYSKREINIENGIKLTASGKSMEVFSDTKEQNGCCRIGQTKLFTKNMPSYKKHFEELLTIWHNKAQEVYSNHDALDLHIHMISTISDADDVYKGGAADYQHKDSIWIWVPNTNQAIHHLSAFLNSFKNIPAVTSNHMQYQVLSNSMTDYENILKLHFSGAVSKNLVKTKKKMPVVILSFDAGTLNSRKAQITPCLPALVK